MDQRVSLITLGVSDLDRSRRFYEALGWQGQEVEETVFFQAGGQAVGLWGRDKLAADAGITADEITADEITADVITGGTAFGGFTLAHNVESREEVDRIVDTARTAGADVTKAPEDTFYGGYAGFFRDPDGHVWEIAWNPGFELGADGTLTLPDFGAAS